MIANDPAVEVRAIPAPSGGNRAFCDRMNSWAQGEGAAGPRLHLLARRRGGRRGPIAKNIGPERTEAIARAARARRRRRGVLRRRQAEGLRRSSPGSRAPGSATSSSLIDKDRFEFCWIVDFPMYEWNEEEKKIDFSHNPFSMPNMAVDEFLALDPNDHEKILGIKAFQYDIVCNGVELSSGAIRNHRPDVMKKAFAIAGYGERRAGGEVRRHAARAFARRAAARRHRARHRPHRHAALRRGEPARGGAVPDEPARRGPADGRAVGGHAEAAARTAHPAQSAAEAIRPFRSVASAAKVDGRENLMPSVMSNLSDDLKNAGARLSPLAASPESSKSSRPSRSATSTTWRWPIRRAWRRPARRSRPIPREAAELTAAAESRRRGLERHRGAGSRQYRPARLEAGDGRQGGAVQEIRRHRRVRHRDRRAGRRAHGRDVVSALEPTFGGINLEDIKAPECFEVEAQLKERMKIPVFHDDQHGTAIIVARRGQNALYLTGKKIDERQDRDVRRGRGGARLSQSAGLARRQAREHLRLRSRRRGLQGPRQADGPLEGGLRAGDRKRERSARVIDGADVFLGALGRRRAEAGHGQARWRSSPLIMALANPNPEIMPEEARKARPDAMICTGRSDLSEPGQQRPVLSLHLPRRARCRRHHHQRGDEARGGGSDRSSSRARRRRTSPPRAYGGEAQTFGPGSLIPNPFDPRLILRIAPAVAKAAMESGVATRPIGDFDAYRERLESLRVPLRLHHEAGLRPRQGRTRSA